MESVVEEGQIEGVRQSQTEKRRGEMNLTDTDDLAATELGLMAVGVEEGVEKRAEGGVGGGSGGNSEEGVELAVGDRMLRYDR